MSMYDRQIWDILQIEATGDKREIKRAYARRCREIHPEEKPEEFQRLYEAYQKALQYASRGETEDRRRENSGINRKALHSETCGDVEEIESESPETSQKADQNKCGVPGTDAEEPELSIYKKFGLYSEDNQEYQYKYNQVEEIAYFCYWWEKHMPTWLQKESLIEESATYLRSESFRKIMWSPVILGIIAEGMGKYFLRQERVLLFFWDIYGFEEAGEEHYKGESLLLYKKLYPAYVNRIKRQQYEENKDEIQRDERRHIMKKMIIAVCIVIGIILIMLVLAHYKILDMALSILLGVVFLLITFWMFVHMIRG